MNRIWRKKKWILPIIFVLAIIALFSYIFYAKENPVLPQATIYFLPEVGLPEAHQKVLVFSPHPDDESLGTGGYIYESIKRGAEVKIVLVTDGGKHHKTKRRYEEFQKATSTLGVPEKDLIYLNYPDGTLQWQNFNILQEKLEINILAFTPDVVIWSDSGDEHPDHAVTGRAVEGILRARHYKGLSYSYLVHHERYPYPKRLRTNLFLLPPANLVYYFGEWEKLMLSNDALAAKKQAVESYRSQLYTPVLRGVMLSSIRQNELFVVKNF